MKPTERDAKHEMIRQIKEAERHLEGCQVYEQGIADQLATAIDATAAAVRSLHQLKAQCRRLFGDYELLT